MYIDNECLEAELMGNNRIKGLVSIVVSNYNNGKYVEQCLNSLINQSYKNIEIIIVDECETYKSLDK